MNIARSLIAALVLVPAAAHAWASPAWWNDDWKQRTSVSINTSAAGVTVQETLNTVAVPVRLHSGNFDFVGAKADGSDLRVVAGDDKTPLKFWIERFDSVNQLAVVWVMVPSVLPGTDKNTIHVYAGSEKPAADKDGPGTPADIADGSTLAVFHFAEKDGVAADQTGALKAAAATGIEPNGLIGQSARLNGTAVSWPTTDAPKMPSTGPFTLGLWLRPDVSQGTLFSRGALQLSLVGSKLVAKLGATTVEGGEVAPATWSQVTLTAGNGKLTLYHNGEQAGQADLGAGGAVDGALLAGEGYQGLVDELEIASTARSADWVKFNYAAQSADAKLIATKTETSADAESSGGSNSYFGILFKSLTPDAWAIILILGVMFVIAAAVMVGKALFIAKTARANSAFLAQFREGKDVMSVGAGVEEFANSNIYRLYSAGLRELVRRNVGKGGPALGGASIDAVKAAIDADSVREGYRLNAQMVLLTIAISGGPFLGLLGTVVGVMITFASIAAAGDVNVNAIAPGIAAALLATVAGLGVAIPSLFGYNYLASRIKTIASDMQIFVDEFVTRVAEAYGAP